MANPAEPTGEDQYPTRREATATADNTSATEDGSLSLKPTPAVPRPAFLGRFEVLEVLGEGGFGIVYRARDTQLQRDVAIKVAKPLRRLPRYRELYLNEAKLLAHLDHPGIVPVFDVGESDDGELYVVSKFIDGRPLSQVMQSRGRDVAYAATTIAVVASSMAYAHQRRVVHRDLKPSNILISKDGHPVVVDFGLAIGERLAGENDGIIGTPSYMSPEQARGESHRVDGRADIYSLGVVLYQWLTGSLPFQADTANKLLDQIRHFEVRPPRQLRRDIPRELERICLRTLSKRASDRHTTAEDLAEDLRAWLAAQEQVADADSGPQRPLTAAADSAHGDSKRSHGSQGAHGSQGSRPGELRDLVPRGLRSYGPADADFFLRMLPGPVDRSGIPECVRFWKQRIEASDLEESFRVGMLMGPSGSGKSSLLRAGILPLLDSRIRVLTLEARPEALKDRLRSRLRQITGSQSLSEDMAVALPQARDCMADDEKLLIVLDQFEGYLHQSDDSGGWLAEALRQCDGLRLQAVLVLRDDFLMAASRFMNALEEPLLQDENFATIDRFGKTHARRVLTGFGIALQAMDPAQPDRETERFVERAVDALAEDGHIVPVRLAMLTEMLKDSPWTVATLKRVGGWEGLGVAFLQERLVGPQTHPQFRRHPELVRRILNALLPVESISIRQHALTVEEIEQRCGSGELPETVRQVLQLLDSEVRLITPASSDDSPDSSLSGARYQLTHDYLVPSIRNWLAVQEEATRRGRLRLALRRAARIWSVTRSPGLLAGPFSWLRWRLLTQRPHWTDVEQQFMQRSQRRVLRQAASWGIAATLLAALVGWGLGQQNAAGLREAIRSAKLDELPGLLDKAHGRLPGLLAVDVASSDVPANFQWALLPQHPELLGPVLEQLKRLSPDQLWAAAALLGRLPRTDWPELWSKLSGGSLRERLVAASLLAHLDTAADRRMAPHVPRLLQDLNSVAWTESTGWITSLKPISMALTMPTLAELRSHDSALDRDRLLMILQSTVPATDTAMWAEIVMALEPRELPAIAELGELPTRSALVAAMRERFQRLAAAPYATASSAGEPLPQHCLQLIQEGYGVADGHFVAVARLPRKQLLALGAELESRAMRLQSWRSTRGDSLFAAAVWVRDGRQSQLIGPLSTDALLDEAEKRQAAGWRVEDVAFETQPAATATAQSVGWMIICSRPGDEPAETDAHRQTVMHHYADFGALREDQKRLTDLGYSLTRCALHVLPDGSPEAVAIWSTDRGPSLDRTTAHSLRYWGYFGDLYPGATASDVRLLPLSAESTGDVAVYSNYLLAGGGDRSELPESPEQWPPELVSRARDARRWDLLLQMDATNWKDKDSEQLASARGRLASSQWLALLQIGHIAEAEERFEQEVVLQNPDSQVIGWRAYAAALQNDPDAALKILRPVLDARQRFTSSHARALAISAMANPQRSEELAARLHSDITTGPAAFQRAALAELRKDPWYDAIRQQPVLQRLLRQQGLAHLCYGVWQGHLNQQGSLLQGNLRDHQQQMRERAALGFLPSCIESDADRALSAWSRDVDLNQESKRPVQLATLAACVAMFGEPDLMETLLQGRQGEAPRDEATWAAAAAQLEPNIFLRLLRESISANLRYALLCGLANYQPSQLADEDRTYLEMRLRDLRSDPDAGVAAAAQWLQKRWQWNHVDRLAAPATMIAADGTQLVRIDPPPRVWIGSHNFEAIRNTSEIGHYTVGTRAYAIGQTEVTLAQFEKFLQDDRVRAYLEGQGHGYSRRYAPTPDCPQISVRWFDAVLYCQWLSEQEKLPESQWCFPGIWDADFEQYKLPANVLDREGYRLPTESEWEYAADTGAKMTWPFGWTPRLLNHYAWTASNSNGTSHGVAQHAPNRLGLFDMLGNAQEWCLNPFQAYRRPVDGADLSWDEWSQSIRSIGSRIRRPVRGGAFASDPAGARTSNRQHFAPGEKTIHVGLRIARTLPTPHSGEATEASEEDLTLDSQPID